MESEEDTENYLDSSGDSLIELSPGYFTPAKKHDIYVEPNDDISPQCHSFTVTNKKVRINGMESRTSGTLSILDEFMSMTLNDTDSEVEILDESDQKDKHRCEGSNNNKQQQSTSKNNKINKQTTKKINEEQETTINNENNEENATGATNNDNNNYVKKNNKGVKNKNTYKGRKASERS